MPSNLRNGGRYLAGRQGIVACLFSVSLSCAFLVVILILCARSVLTLYSYTLSSPSLSLTNIAVSDAVLSHYNRLHESPVLQPFRLPDDIKTVHPEKETYIVLDQEGAAEDEGDAFPAAGRKQATDILFRDGWEEGSQQVLSPDRGSVLPLAGSDGITRKRLYQVENLESKKLNRHKFVTTREGNHAVSAPVRENISPTDLLNWKGDLEGIDLREPLRNLTSKERRVWLQLNWANFKILQADSLSEQFSNRLKRFFHGHEDTGQKEIREEDTVETGNGRSFWRKSLQKRLLGSDSQPSHENMRNLEGSFPERVTGRKVQCKLRFFMTWISPTSSFGLRERICLESVFTFHPTACLVILSRSLDTAEGRVILQPFVDRGLQILAVSPDLPFLFRETPAAKWFQLLKSGVQDPGEISFSQNLSNILRMAVVYKYGGIYLDNDVLLLKDLSGLQNILGAQSANSTTGEWTRLNNAVMIFERKSPVLLKFIQEFALTYDGNKWGHNGPYLVTRVIRRLTGRAGYNFTVASPAAFYPVNWARIQTFFKAPNTSEEWKWQVAKLEQLERETYAVHLWNKASRNMHVQKQSVMDIMFQKVCLFCETSLRGGRAES